MGLAIEFADEMENQGARLKVIGVGGGGGNALNTMIQAGLDGVDFIAANTDSQALEANFSPTRLQMGSNLTKGLGAGANPEVGKKAALEDMQRIADTLAGADMVFVTAGMGGGTGTGGAPIIAQIARECGALTVGVVTRPFAFEGRRRAKVAEAGIAALGEAVDTLITIPNQGLLALDPEISALDAFRKADEVLLNAVRAIADLITQPGLINVDFADVRTIMNGAGRALMAAGYGKGDRRALDAMEMAIQSPLLEDVSIEGATGVLLNFTGGPDLTIAEINEAASMIESAAAEEVNVIFGHCIDETFRDAIKITVIATGFDAAARVMEPAAATASTRTSQLLTREAATAAMRATRRSEPPAAQQVPMQLGREGSWEQGTDLEVPAFIRRNQG